MEDRAELLDQQFIQCVKEGRFPEARSQPDPESVGLSSHVMTLWRMCKI